MTQPLDVTLQWLEHGEGLNLPTTQTTGAAGFDLCAAVAYGERMTILPGARAMVPCGFCMALPVGYEGQVRPRSGLAAKFGVTVLNAPGTIDADYRGEVKVILINHGSDPFEVKRGDRIAQLVVVPVTSVTFHESAELTETARGADGFGSTGYANG